MKPWVTDKTLINAEGVEQAASSQLTDQIDLPRAKSRICDQIGLQRDARRKPAQKANAGAIACL